MIDNSAFSLLTQINTPEDLRKLKVEQLPQLCQELRQYIWEVLAQNPGHLASSLGVIELTVALHYVYNTPYDRLVWDVGHQAYGHKILTGRRENFHTNRKLGGVKPFPSPQESEYDTFACGHASNSISAALGMATAALQNGQEDRRVVAIIGDGAMSGGLAFEGLNNASDTPNNMLIILNDNNMSIDRAVGGMTNYLMQLQTSNLYNRLRFKLARKMTEWGWLNENRRRSILRFNNSVKALLTNQQNVFEGMNIRYIGPTNGHDVVELVRILKEIKNMKGPKLLHLHTVKGKGFKQAEENPTVWHAPGLFDADNGQRTTAGCNRHASRMYLAIRFLNWQNRMTRLWA
jgi:1-deoxy-D-xylulose-5-phosphate synthase